MLVALLIVLTAAPRPSGWQATTEVFGEPARIEVHGLEAAAAESALRAAVAELAAAEAEVMELTGRLNGAGGDGPQPVAATALALLGRALDFCRWSQGAHGPLGGALYELWQRALPAATELTAATATAGCDRLQLDPDAGTAELAAGSRLDLRGFATGWAVDRAAAVLRAGGAGTARLRLGRVQLGLGSGPAGDGWGTELGLPEEWIEPLPPVRLSDRALAVAGLEPALVIAGDRYPPHLDQRSGRPAAGTAATVAVSELALDAQALAVSMFVLGQREGMLRLGALRPEPAVAWLLGSGEAPPLLTTHRWRTLDER